MILNVPRLKIELCYKKPGCYLVVGYLYKNGVFEYTTKNPIYAYPGLDINVKSHHNTLELFNKRIKDNIDKDDLFSYLGREGGYIEGDPFTFRYPML